MTREQILNFLRQHKQEMYDRFGVTRIGLFGSYARGDAREDSDINRSQKLFLLDILESIKAIESYVVCFDFYMFRDDL